MIGTPATGSSALGMPAVMAAARFPNPPATIAACMSINAS
jgi:hypothetical protein